MCRLSRQLSRMLSGSKIRRTPDGTPPVIPAARTCRGPERMVA